MKEGSRLLRVRGVTSRVLKRRGSAHARGGADLQAEAIVIRLACNAHTR